MLARLALLLCLGPIAGACGGSTVAAPASHSGLQHVVLIELLDAADADALIADSRTELAAIPGVTALVAGRPVDIGRDDVDGDYDVGILVAFANEEDYRAYLVHERHVALVQAWKARWAGYRIFDFTD